MSENDHCFEHGRMISFLNENSEELAVEFKLVRELEDADRVPVVWLLIADLGGEQRCFRLWSREDCDKVINALTETRNSAFPLP